jgi:PAS domain S-box-containing protein
MRSFKVVLGFLFSVLTLSVLVLGVLAYKTYQKSNSASHRVDYSREVLEQVEIISLGIMEAQLESNAALIVHDTTPLARYRQAREAVEQALDSLKSLTGANVSQHERAKGLGMLISKLFVTTDSSFEDTTPLTTASMNARFSDSGKIRIRILSAIDDIKSKENELLLDQERSNQESVGNFNRLFVTLLIFVFATIGAMFLSIKYNFDKRMVVENKLIRANELFHKLFYDSPIALVISQPEDGVIIDCNTVYAKLTNYKREEIIGQSSQTLGIARKDIDRNKIIGSTYPTGMPHGFEMEIWPRYKDPVWTRISSQPIQLRERNCLLTALIDISAHKEAEANTYRALEKEKELNKLKSNFVSLASHEFRTPLTTILSSAFLLENYLPQQGSEKAIKHLSRIKSAVNSLTTILDEFLSLTKIEEGKVTPSHDEIDLKALLTAICRTQKEFARSGQVIELMHRGKETVISDPAMLTGIMTNLVSNSIKYSPENSTIKVAAEVHDNWFSLTVTDSGIGIPVADQEHLFERFYRASNAGTSQGTGLGLHITKHYVELLGGTILFTTKPQGGTSFTVTFDHNKPYRFFNILPGSVAGVVS